MIRFLFYLIVFFAGLAAAVVYLGEMRHLRQVLPDDLPTWTNFIEDSARIPGGAARLSVPFGPNVALRWQNMAPGADGLKWDLSLSGLGLEARADLRLPYWPEMAVLQNGTGTVDLSGTLYRIEAINGEVPLLDRASAGFIEIQLEPNATLPTSVAQALQQVGDVNGPRIRIPIPPIR